jgi:uncharacterized membrane protein
MSAVDVNPPLPATDEGLRLVMPGRRVDAGRGASWISEGWKLFARAPLMWIIAMVVLFVLMVMMHLIPILGGIAFQVLQMVIWGGFVAACRSLETGGEFEIEHLLSGFTRRFGKLAILGALFLLGGLAIMLVYFAFVGFSILGAVLSGDTEAVRNAILASIGGIVLGALVSLALVVPLLAAIWFAPALVYMHDVRPVEAMKASLGASFRNFVPFLVYGVIMMVLAIIAMIPLGLGMLVFVPLSITSAYASYRDVFTEEAAPVARG